MVSPVKAATVRMTADERREDILVAARAEFARGGLHGTSTETIAARAGISQPYLFRLFGTKKELFIATYRRCCGLVYEAFERAATEAADARTAEDKLNAMGRAYEDVLLDQDMLRTQMHAYVAAADPGIRGAVREEYARLFALVERASGAPAERVLAFFATGMLLNVSALLGHAVIDPGEPEAWAAEFRSH
ncbi:MAG: TetR/AcrR family transcriptional regulator [Solirubrobacteraceae bacterium]